MAPEAPSPDPAAGAGGRDPLIAPGVRLPLDELRWRFSTAGGPGGQHVNTSNTRAEATFDIAGSPSLPEWARQRLLGSVGDRVTVASGDTRSQSRNRDLATERLAARLRAALEPRRSRRPTRPTAASQRRRLDAKRRRGQLKNRRRDDSRPDEG